MPTTPILDSTNSRRMFSYDEMVMSSDGTRYYIKYLDGPPPKPRTTLTPQSQADSTKIVQRPTTTASSQLLAKRITTQAPSNEAKRQRIETIATQNRVTPQQQFLCGICQQKFNNRASLNFHIERMHKDTDGPIDCPCGKRFANKKYMKRHQKRRFETERIICGREPATTSVNGFQLSYKNL